MNFLNILLILVPFVMGTKRYYMPNFKTNWYKALEFCLTQGMDMVSIHSQQDHNELVKFLKGSDKFSNAARFWLGANDLAEEGVYKWVSSGQPFTFTNWADNEPNNDKDNEHCIEIIHSTYYKRIWKWNDNECRQFRAYFVCESGDQEGIEQF